VYHSHLQSSLCDPRYACRACLAGRVGCSYTLPCEVPCVCTVGVLQVGVSVVCRSRSAYNSHLQSSVRNLLPREGCVYFAGGAAEGRAADTKPRSAPGTHTGHP